MFLAGYFFAGAVSASKARPPSLYFMESLKKNTAITVAELKQIIKDWPEQNELGQPCEVWISTGEMLSCPCVSAGILNKREGDRGIVVADIILSPSDEVLSDQDTFRDLLADKV